MKHTVHVTIVVDIEAISDEGAVDIAGTWAAAMLEGIRPKCTACRGTGIEAGGLRLSCRVCDGAQHIGEHPYRPRVYRVKESA